LQLSQGLPVVPVLRCGGCSEQTDQSQYADRDS
jgi:hypothetical protein